MRRRYSLAACLQMDEIPDTGAVVDFMWSLESECCVVGPYADCLLKNNLVVGDSYVVADT